MVDPRAFLVEDQRFEVDAHAWRSDEFVVASVPRPYPVRWRAGKPIELVAEALTAAPRTVLVVDHNVDRLHLGGLSVAAERRLVVTATERWKSLELGVTAVLDLLVGAGVTKADRVVVVGGGIVQDVCAFACAMHRRGVPWTFIPSTLLAMADSCIGAKAGLNRHETKNLLGLFSAPSDVILCPSFLRTLDDAALASGLGEVVKLHVTAGEGMLTAYDALVASSGRAALSDETLRQLILSSLAVKRAVVEADEFEKGARKALNFGHTVGHALEALTEYAIPHGQAVALGMIAACSVGSSIGATDPSWANEIKVRASRLVDAPSRAALSDLAFDRLIELLARDKKADQGGILFVVPAAPGRLVFRRVALDERLRATIAESLAGELKRSGHA